MKIIAISVLLAINILGQLLNIPDEHLQGNQRTFLKTDQDSSSIMVLQIIQYWNGTEWENQSKVSIKYNALNKKEFETNYWWNGLGWDETKRTVYLYDNVSQLIEIYVEEAYLNWDTTLVVHYAYDQKGREIKRTVKSWDRDQSSYYQSKTNTQYDISDNIIIIENSQLAEDGAWINVSRTIYNYDTNSNLIERLEQSWISNSWINNSRYNVLFDGNGDKIKSVQLLWRNSDWDTLNMFSFTYNELRQLREQNTKVKQKGVWINVSKFSYSYNAIGKLSIQKFQYWIDSALVNGNMNFYEYNVNGKISQQMEQGWRNNSWDNNSKLNYGYDEKGNLINKIYHGWSNGIWTNAVLYTYVYDEVSGYKGKDVIINRFELSNNYPNPFNPSTVIGYQVPVNSFVTLKVYDVLGNEVATLVNEEKPTGNYEVELSSHKSEVSSGVYFYQLRAGGFVQTKKMLLLK